LLEGRLVNLKLMERDDAPLFAEWMSNPDVTGEYEGLAQLSKSEVEKFIGAEDKHEERDFFIQKKDGTKIGLMAHFYVLHVAPSMRQLEIGYFLLPSERGRGYCSEATCLTVDYLFLSKDAVRIQARTDVRNLASQKVLEKAGFRKEGTMRHSAFIRGEWRDLYLYSILRQEWREPKILVGR
jgi:ribosomal-protein-alanine N-acetyltransferase